MKFNAELDIENEVQLVVYTFFESLRVEPYYAYSAT